MHIRFEADSKVETKSGNSARTGKAYAIREQEGYLLGLGKYPVRISVTLPDNVQQYAAGDYEMATPFRVGAYNRLEVSRDLGLIPLASKAAAPRAA